MQQTSSFKNIDQLVGNWYQTQKAVENKGVVTNLEIQCSGQSFWKIANENGKYSLLKHFATGKNCDTHVIKTNGLTYTNGNLNYLESDIYKSEKLEKLGDNKFKITEKSFANGETIFIENFYERK